MLIMKTLELIDKLSETHNLTKEEYLYLLDNIDKEGSDYLFSKSRQTALANFGNKIYIRGLIEYSNYCKNGCYYCGLNKGNLKVRRYRLTKEQILDSCKIGYTVGFRTFVLQGGEDLYFNDEIMVDIVGAIRSKYPDCAITLSMGERSYDSYKKLYDAGANRYLLRHETANESHYYCLHPRSMSFKNRFECLNNLKSIGYQTGTGFMVGSPNQTNENIANDLVFIQEFQPQMVGIGPFLPHSDTIFKHKMKGSEEKTLICIALLRLMIPQLLIPATTALGTIDFTGREKGILAGANVVMPNLSPTENRKAYSIYDNKISTEETPGEMDSLIERLQKIGYEITIARGDFNDKKI